MNLANVGGIFLLLVTGGFLAILINFVNFLFYVKKQADDNNVSTEGKLILLKRIDISLHHTIRFPFVRNSWRSSDLCASSAKWLRSCDTVNPHLRHPGNHHL